MKIKFSTTIKRGNQSGAGFFYIPKDKIDLFDLGDWICIELSKNIHFFSKIIFYSHRVGVYVPQSIMEANGLLGKEVKIQLKKINGFYTRMYSDGRIYIPQGIVKNQNLKQNDIVLVKGIKDDKIIKEKYSKIHLAVRMQRNQKEYTCAFDKNLYGKELIFKIEKLPDETEKVKPNPATANILEKMHYGFKRNLVKKE